MSAFSELIDFTRSSTGTYLDSVVYGDELVTNGTFDTDSDWAKGTGWAISGGTASKTAGTGSSIVSTTLSGTIGKSYLLTFDLTLSAGVINSTLGASVTPVYDSSGSYAEILKPTTTGAFYFYGSAAFAGSIDNVSVKEIIGGQGTAGTPLLRTADTNEPRLEYDASGQPLGLLIEEQRTNLISSSNFNNVTKENVTTVNDYAVAPDGTNTAVAMFETTNNYFHRAYNTASFLNGNTYTQSVFLKSIGGRAGQLTMTSSGFGTIHANFDLVNGVVGTKNNCESQITPVGNGWYRCSITATAIGDSGGDASVVSVTSPTSTRLQNYAGDTSKGLLVYGLQVEQGAFPTSYIPTSGSTVTRNHDVASTTAFKYHQNNTQGTLYAEFTPNISSTSYKRAAEFYYSNLRFSIQMYTGKIAYYTRNAANSTNNSIGTQNPYTPYRTQKSAFTVSEGYAAKSSNGLDVESETDVLGLGEDNVVLYIGQNNAGAYINGHIKHLRYFPTKLSNDELVELTKPSSSPTMSLTFDGQATSELVEGLHD